MSTLALSTGQEYNTHLKKDLVSAPKKALSAVGSGLKAATFGGAGAVIGDIFGETAGSLVSSLGMGGNKKDDKSKSWGDIANIIKAELKGLIEPIQEEKKEEKKVTAKKVKEVASPSVIDAASFMSEIVKASHEQIESLIKEKGITDEKVIVKLKEAEQAALEEIAKSLQASHGKDGLTVEHLRNIEANTQQLLGIMGKSEEEKFEANKPTAQKVAVTALTENENSPLGGLFGAFKKLTGMFGGLGSSIASFGSALTTAMGVISKLPMKGLATGALAAVAIDALTDAYSSFKTGESNKYADAANSAAEGLGLVKSGESIGSGLYDFIHKNDGPDFSNMDDATRVKVKSVMEKAKVGAPLTEAEKVTATTYEIDTSKSKIIPSKKAPTAVAAPTNTSSPQSEQAKEVVASTAQLNATSEAKAQQPIVIPMPVPQQASKAAEDVLNYVTTNGESTFRRLSDRLFSTAFV